MKMKLKKEWSYPYIYIDVPVAFKEDYKLKMMKNNQIDHILSITGSEKNGESRYGFRLKTGTSMDEFFLKRKITKETIISFTEQLLQAIEGLRSCMLSPDGILLYPEFIFVEDSHFDFCYLPACGSEISIRQSFHELTEYFVDKIDYRDTEAIILSYCLHKESLREFYDLKSAIENSITELKKYEEENQQKSVSTADEVGHYEIKHIQNNDENRIMKEYTYQEHLESVREQKEKYGAIQKVISRIKNGRWGNWDDLITEISEVKK